MKLFKDLPSQDTPINASALNQIQHNLVVVSATEPTGDNREKVWIQKGKNLFNKNSGIVSGSYLGNDGRIGSDINLFYQTDYIPAAPNTKYVISSDIEENHRIAEYDNNKTFIKRNLNDGGGSAYVFTTSSNCYFVRISCNISNLDNIQLEQNSTATEYEAYIEPKMYVKNDNDVYENFYDWEQLEEKLTEFKTYSTFWGTKSNGKVGSSFDLDNLPAGENCYYSTSNGLPTHYAGSTANTNYFVICMYNITTYGKIQICFPDGSTTNDNNIYLRFNWSGWKSWRKIGTTNI